MIEDISTQNKNEYFSVDESDFVKINGQILWVIGVLNNETYHLRLEVSYTRNEDVLKKIIRTHIKSGNYKVRDGWPGYLWIGRPYSGYIYSTHNHGHGNFGHGLDSTSHIEGIWAFLKNIIKGIYKVIPNDNFILFLQESEFRRNINQFNNEKKWNEFIDILKYLYNWGSDDFYPES